jgi:hypothetical protein
MSSAPGCEVRLNCLEQKTGDFLASVSHGYHLPLPEVFKPGDIRRAQRDCEILGKILQSHPGDVSALLENAVKNNITGANQIASKLGLSEEEFTRQGGGCLWLLIAAAIFVACIIGGGEAKNG